MRGNKQRLRLKRKSSFCAWLFEVVASSTVQNRQTCSNSSLILVSPRNNVGNLEDTTQLMHFSFSDKNIIGAQYKFHMLSISAAEIQVRTCAWNQRENLRAGAFLFLPYLHQGLQLFPFRKKAKIEDIYDSKIRHTCETWTSIHTFLTFCKSTKIENRFCLEKSATAEPYSAWDRFLGLSEDLTYDIQKDVVIV